MKVYEVGGAVRDALLGRPVQDRDWVVVGATAQQMLDAGYQQVGRDFPVFLHPDTHEEYALARTERKSGHGYAGFVFHNLDFIDALDGVPFFGLYEGSANDLPKSAFTYTFI